MQLDPYNADYKEAMSFIAKLFHEENYNYGVLAVVRSALFCHPAHTEWENVWGR